MNTEQTAKDLILSDAMQARIEKGELSEPAVRTATARLLESLSNTCPTLEPIRSTLWSGPRNRTLFYSLRPLIDANASDSHGESLLMTAASKNQGWLVDELIEMGADTNAVDHRGVGVLGYNEFYPKMIERLMGASAYPTHVARYSPHFTAAQYALHNNKLDLVEAYLDAGVDAMEPFELRTDSNQRWHLLHVEKGEPRIFSLHQWLKNLHDYVKLSDCSFYSDTKEEVFRKSSSLLKKIGHAQERFAMFMRAPNPNPPSLDELKTFSMIGKIGEAFESHRWQGNEAIAHQYLQQLPDWISQRVQREQPWLADAPKQIWSDRISHVASPERTR